MLQMLLLFQFSDWEGHWRGGEGEGEIMTHFLDDMYII